MYSSELPGGGKNMDAPAMTAKELPLYEKLAETIRQQIDAGSFNAGERIPSVRESSQARRLSMTTVLQAYRLLEDQGVLEARPQSGYYVRPRPSGHHPEPELSAPSLDPVNFSMADLYDRLVRDSRDPALAQLGVAHAAADLLPTAKLNRLIAAAARESGQYATVCGIPEGCEELRVQIAQRAFRIGSNVGPQDLLITNGCMEAINLALRAICRPGDLVAIESPTFFGILQVLAAQGLQVIEIPTHHRTGVNLEALRFALDHHPIKACLFILNFNNPLGSCMPDENKEELVKLLAQREIPLIEDDLCGDLYFCGQRPKAAQAYDQKGLVLYCSSFSKDISPNSRVGWLAPGKFMQQVRYLKLTLNLGTAIVPQLAIARLLASGGYDYHLRKIRRAYEQKVAQMSQSILRYFPCGTRLTEPNGGFVLWVQLPETVDALELYDLALKHNITLAPGHMFSPTQKYRNFIRLNAAYWSYETDRTVQQVGELAQRLAARKTKKK
jgi:DNA-binding transcriptional MocR family regulator